MKTIIRVYVLLVIFQSITFSQGWVSLNTGGTRDLSYIDFLDENTGFVGPPLMRTTDGGNSWLSLPGTANYQSVCFIDINTGYAGDGGIDPGALYKTTNGGINWVVVAGYPTLFPCQFDFINANTGYFVGNHDWIFTPFYGTTNGGQTWNLLKQNMFNPTPNASFNFYKLKFLNVNTGFLSAATYDNNYWNGTYVLKTTDGGLNWATTIYSTSYRFPDFSFPSVNNGFLISESIFGRIFDYNGNFIFTAPNRLYRVYSVNNSIAYSVGDTGGIVKTTNGGLNWNVQNSNTSIRLNAVEFLNGNTGYIAGNGGTVLKTNTGGETPLTISGTIRYQDNNQPVTSGYVKALHFDSASANITTIDSAQIQSNGSYMMMRIPPHISLDIMAFENDEAQLSYVPTYYPSTTNWQNATSLTLDSSLTNINILVYRISNPGGPLHIAGHITKLSQNPYVGLYGAIVYAKTGSLYQGYSISDNNGMYRVDSLSAGSYNVIVDRMGFGEITRPVILTNFSKDTIDFIMDNLTGLESQNQIIPKDYWLSSNYPNPFNPETNIKFGIPKDAKVNLVIYDILGREVAKLVNGELKAGVYSVNWNASSYASGIYFYKLEARQAGSSTGSFVQTKKMVLIK